MRWLMVLGALAVPSIAFAGELHSREYYAVVVSVAVVKSFELEDRLAQLHPTDPEVTSLALRVVAPVCRVRVRVESDYRPLSDKPIDLYASTDACKQIRPGLRTQVQYFGLAHMFRLIAIQVDGTWRALPRMRVTTSAEVQQCFATRERRCAKVHFDAPL